MGKKAPPLFVLSWCRTVSCSRDSFFPLAPWGAETKSPSGPLAHGLGNNNNIGLAADVDGNVHILAVNVHLLAVEKTS